MSAAAPANRPAGRPAAQRPEPDQQQRQQGAEQRDGQDETGAAARQPGQARQQLAELLEHPAQGPHQQRGPGLLVLRAGELAARRVGGLVPPGREGEGEERGGHGRCAAARATSRPSERIRRST